MINLDNLLEGTNRSDRRRMQRSFNALYTSLENAIKQAARTCADDQAAYDTVCKLIYSNHCSQLPHELTAAVLTVHHSLVHQHRPSA